MYSFTPKHKNSNAHVISAAFCAMFFITLLLPSRSYVALIKFFGFACLTLGLYCIIRYFLRGYRYDLEPDAEADYNFELTITELQGKRRTVVCRINATEISGFEKYDAKKLRKKKNIKIYNYCVDICPDAIILWLADDPLHDSTSMTSGVLFMPDLTMLRLIEDCIPPTPTQQNEKK